MIPPEWPRVTCRLTAFVFPLRTIEHLALGYGRRNLRAFEEYAVRHADESDILRYVSLAVLLRLLAGKRVPFSVRAHAALLGDWRSRVRVEHRRMLQRLHGAVARLRRKAERGC